MSRENKITKRKVKTIAVVTPNGGFMISEISFWKMVPKTGPEGNYQILTVWFKGGGFLEIPDYDSNQFGSFIAGEPY